jgi:hypothetical protein
MTTYSSQPAEAAGTDTFINSVAPTTNYATYDPGYIGNETGGSDWTCRMLIKFDLSSIPSYAVPTSGSLTFTAAADLSQNTRWYRMYRTLRAWTEAGATWNKYDGTNNWTTAGCGSNGNDADFTNEWSSVSVPDTGVTTIVFTLSATGLSELAKMINGTYQNNGWIIKADDEVNDAWRVYTSSYATSGSRPILVIEYVAGGKMMIWTSE